MYEEEEKDCIEDLEDFIYLQKKHSGMENCHNIEE